MEELMLRIDNVSKRYKLGQIGGTTLRDELQRLNARIRGKEDPTKRVGAKDYNKGESFMALDGVSFDVKKGERVGIIGHNGAGKSTLLKLISRVTAPTGGTIGLNGRVASMLEVGTGFHQELTGRENIYMNGAILGMTKKEIDAKMEDIIEFSECRQFIDTPVKRYSSGMYVKLAFSVAAHLDSEIMIMDEVLAVGDMAFQKKCLNKMSDVSKSEGRTILYVSHNMNTIRQLCDRCIVLNKGKLVFDGDVENAIAIYSGTENHDYPADYSKKTLKWEYRQPCGATFESLSFSGKSQAIYKNGEIMCLDVVVDFTQIVSNMQMGFQLYSEAQETIGFGYTLLDIVETGKQGLRFQFDVSMLPEGIYCFRLILHTKSDTNSFVGEIDQTNYIYFKVLESDNQMIWHREWWKNVKINTFRLL